MTALELNEVLRVGPVPIWQVLYKTRRLGPRHTQGRPREGSVRRRRRLLTRGLGSSAYTSPQTRVLGGLGCSTSHLALGLRSSRSSDLLRSGAALCPRVCPRTPPHPRSGCWLGAPQKGLPTFPGPPPQTHLRLAQPCQPGRPGARPQLLRARSPPV